MSDGRLTDAQLDELKARNPCDQVAAQWVALRRGGKGMMVGPCPICSDDRQSRKATVFECNAEGWVCARCHDGGDVITLVQKVEALDFRAAVERLGGSRELDAAAAARIDAERAARKAVRDRDTNVYRERERENTFGIWLDGKPLAGSTAEAVLKLRHLKVPAGCKLRALEQLGYFERVNGEKWSTAIHRGPAMLAPIVDADGVFAGLHMTYLDLAQPKGKAVVRHPDTGEQLVAKKVRGSKAGNTIVLKACTDPRGPLDLVIGEGIETVLSVWMAYVAAGRPLDRVEFRSAVDLGNIGGKALESVRHPTLKSDKGRPRRVPGPQPDLEAPAIIIPASVVRVVILGDSDSDPFLTGMTAVRAAARWAAPGRAIVVAWPPAGVDFNDLAPAWPRILQLVDEAVEPVVPEVSAGADQAPASKAAAPLRRVHSASSPSTDAGSAEDSVPPDPADDEAALSSFAPPSPLPPSQGNESGATLSPDDRIDESVILEASELDHSDTDNAQRLRLYFGDDLTVMAQAGVPAGEWLAWAGQHWDLENGAAKASVIAQRVGELIKAEADVMTATKAERKAIGAADAARKELQAIDAAEDTPASEDRRRELAATIEAGAAARKALTTRKKERRKHGVQSKNAARMDAMLRTLAPHVRRLPDDFNRDRFLAVTRSHTLRFRRTVDAAGAVTAKVEAVAAHDRTDLITAMIPVDYDPKATCPKFLANMERFQPDPDQRRTVQAFSGIGLLGVPLQKIMYHYGTGGNFKSVFLEVVTRTLGDSFAIGLPAESISGREERGAGQASPDLARVFGKRMLRVLELPDGQPLQASTIKKLTGGEKWPVRTLFKGYFEFQPLAKTHMSGNSLPHFDGSDGGMKRRLIIVEWPVTIVEAEQRDFEDVVSEMMAEAPGILNWLIAGALDYLANGLFIAKTIRALTQEQVEEMDPIGQFYRDCVVPDPGGPGVQARAMFAAYKSWSEANAKRLRTETKFGREMKKLCTRNDVPRIHVYVDVRLSDVPAAARSRDDRDDDVPSHHDEAGRHDDVPAF